MRANIRTVNTEKFIKSHNYTVMQPLKAEDSMNAISLYNNIISDALYSHITIIYVVFIAQKYWK